MSSILPAGISLGNQLYIGLMYEGSWLQGMVPALVTQVADGQAMKLPVNDRNKFAGGFLVAVCKLF